jgi:hypothetical protein
MRTESNRIRGKKQEDVEPIDLVSSVVPDASIAFSLAALTRPPQITSRDLVLFMNGDYSGFGESAHRLGLDARNGSAVRDARLS